MKSHTVYKTFRTTKRREFVRITAEVEQAVAESGVREGMVLVSAMHITAGVWVNDDDPDGILVDALEWLDKIAPPSWQAPANEVARALLPAPRRLPAPCQRGRQRRRPSQEPSRPSPSHRAHHGGTPGSGPWQQIFYCEFDGGRNKRLVIKVLGE